MTVQQLLLVISGFIVGIFFASAFLLKKISRYKSMIYIDKLTGLKNSNYLDSSFSKYLFPGTCFILIDIDNFKDFNTRFGYELADEALKVFANTMKDVITPEIEIVRYKFGDEFLIITKNKSINEALLFVENLKTRLCNSVMRINDQNEPVFFSFGVTEYKEGDGSSNINMRLINSLAIGKTGKLQVKN